MRANPTGSLATGICARLMALHINIVELGVSLLSCAASSARQSVKSSGVHVFAAWTSVWLIRSESKPVSHGNTDHLIAQS